MCIYMFMYTNICIYTYLCIDLYISIYKLVYEYAYYVYICIYICMGSLQMHDGFVTNDVCREWVAVCVVVRKCADNLYIYIIRISAKSNLIVIHSGYFC